jgi:predicted nucleic acid-binding protein
MGVVALLSELVTEGRAVLIGPIRQEILSGVRERRMFERLRGHLSAFEEQPIGIEEYEEAARCANRCRAAGIAGSSVDFLICAVSLHRKLAILTTDGDFKSFARVLPITLLGQ